MKISCPKTEKEEGDEKMGEPLMGYSPSDFYQEAKNKLEEKDLLGFVENIGINYCF